MLTLFCDTRPLGALLLLAVLISSCGHDVPIDPEPPTYEEPLTDPLVGSWREDNFGGIHHFTIWTFHAGTYRAVAHRDSAAFQRASGFYSAYRTLDTDPPGWGSRGTRITVERWRDGRWVDRGLSRHVWDYSVLPGDGVILWGGEFLLHAIEGP